MSCCQIASTSTTQPAISSSSTSHAPTSPYNISPRSHGPSTTAGDCTETGTSQKYWSSAPDSSWSSPCLKSELANRRHSSRGCSLLASGKTDTYASFEILWCGHMDHMGPQTACVIGYCTWRSQFPFGGWLASSSAGPRLHSHSNSISTSFADSPDASNPSNDSASKNYYLFPITAYQAAREKSVSGKDAHQRSHWAKYEDVCLRGRHPFFLGP